MSRSINLLPDPVIDTQRDFTKIYQGVILTIIGIIIFGLLNMVLFFLSQQAQTSLAESQEQADILSREISNLKPVEQKILNLQEYLSDYQRVKNMDSNFREHWELIVSAVSKDMLLSGVSQNAEGIIDLSVSTASLSNAVDFLLVLKNSQTLSNFQVLEINYAQTSGRYFFETRVATT